jgi:hypothetical protein
MKVLSVKIAKKRTLKPQKAAETTAYFAYIPSM